MTKGLEDLPYEKRVKKLEFFSPGEGLERNLINGISVLKEQVQRGQRLSFHKETPGQHTGK